MCTAITLLSNAYYFGRNLDLDHSYKETVTITPRNYPLHFRKKATLKEHYAMIGMAYVYEKYPLYYEATNEKGLSIAALNFPENADYKPESDNKDNIAPFEFIPWILGQCNTVAESRKLLSRMNILKEHYNEHLPLSPLHWLISDKHSSITVESEKEGIKVYLNPIGILTNNPPFPTQFYHLNNYMHLSSQNPENLFSQNLDFRPYSRGMGALGLPGDWSSQSRFIKAAFTKENSVCGLTETESVSQFFHILSSVEHPKGCVCTETDRYQITVYSCCCNTDKGIYYYKTYGNSQITAIDMYKTDLNNDKLISYPLLTEQNIRWQN